MADNQQCPRCSSPTQLSLKPEAGYFKYWFDCHDRDNCGWESKTFRGPKVDPDESRIPTEGYEKGMEEARQKAVKEAGEKTTNDFQD